MRFLRIAVVASGVTLAGIEADARAQGWGDSRADQKAWQERWRDPAPNNWGVRPYWWSRPSWRRWRVPDRYAYGAGTYRYRRGAPDYPFGWRNPRNASPHADDPRNWPAWEWADRYGYAAWQPPTR